MRRDFKTSLLFLKSNYMNRYFITFLILLAIEITIATLHFNFFIRGFLGDLLVVPLIYTFVKTFLKTEVTITAICVLLFAYLVEMLQFFKLAELLEIKSRFLLIVIGSVFDPFDFLAYTMGFLLILLTEKIISKS